MLMRVQILHNQNERNCVFDGYTEGDPLIRVYDGEPDHYIPYREDLEVGLNFVYEQNQYAPELQRIPWYPSARSMITGDVICLNDKAYAVERRGFKELPGFEVPA